MLVYKNRHEYLKLMRVDKPVGFFLLWWPAMWALWLASNGAPSIKNIFIFTLGSFLMRSAGCVINDFADRKIDKHVERTQDRPLTSGRVRSKEALVLFFSLCALSFVLVLFTNTKTIYLSLVAVFLATLYPFTKRWFMFPQFFLGAAFSWAVVMVFAAENAELSWQVAVLYFAVLAWTVAYDTFYGMVDQKDDELIGVKSTAIWFGKYAGKITFFLQLFVLVCLSYIGLVNDFTLLFFMFLSLVLGLFLFQQYLIGTKIRENYFKAFLNNQWVGVIIFMAILSQYLFS